jgi:DNA-binding MarR family transcriptional regulator
MTTPVANRLDVLRALGRALRRSSRLTQVTLDGVLSKGDLNFGQWSALLIVVDAGEITVGDLSREAEITSGAMTRLVDCLEERGLVRRDRSAADRRLVKVVSTPAALAAVRTIGPAISSTWSERLSEFPTLEIAELTGHLLRLVAALERRSSPG